jgi:hypothetical protein
VSAAISTAPATASAAATAAPSYTVSLVGNSSACSEDGSTNATRSTTRDGTAASPVRVCIVLRGVPGSGKSALATQLLLQHGASTNHTQGTSSDIATHALSAHAAPTTARTDTTAHDHAIICSADAHLIDADGTYNFSLSRRADAHAECWNSFTEAVEAGKMVRAGIRICLAVERYDGGASVLCCCMCSILSHFTPRRWIQLVANVSHVTLYNARTATGWCWSGGD